MTTPPHSGLFWTPEVKPTKQKSEAPYAFWKEEGYMPPYSIEPVDYMSDDELAKGKGGTLIFDIELYPNYFLAAFQCVTTGKVICIETEMRKLSWILSNYKIIGFNSNDYDLPICALAIQGKTIEELKYASDMLIEQRMRGWEMLRSFKVEPLEIDHIDLIEVAPLSGSLKIYGGRLNAPRMQDLPFDPNSNLTEPQIELLKSYCINDLETTKLIYDNLQEQLEIRKGMSSKYGIDLRSKSDAQLAEAVIKVELTRMGGKPRKPEMQKGDAYRYNIPSYIKYKSPVLQELLADIKDSWFVLDESGYVIAPKSLIDPSTWDDSVKKKKPRKFELFGMTYAVGIGGLHSCEKSVSHIANNSLIIKDFDVSSYYPACILNQNLHPEHLGMNFLSVYRSLVSRRLKAKKDGNKTEADMLKIVINGSFGKFGSRWSLLFAPQLLIQTTLTGQLSMLMLIEQLSMSGIKVISGNTDGVVMTYPEALEDVVQSTVKEWEKQTDFETEETQYSALYSRDVNSYVAIKPDGEVKLKGAYSIGKGIFRFHKNPVNIIATEAAVAYLKDGIPVSRTIRECGDFAKFLTVRAVKGGAVKGDQYLGKAVRFYYSTTSSGNIVYARNGNSVPKSENAQPCMQLPSEFPDDVDYARYELETLQILRDVGGI